MQILEFDGSRVHFNGNFHARMDIKMTESCRSDLLDGRRIHAPGDVTFSGGKQRSFTPDDSDEEMRAFLEEGDE